MSRGNGAFGLWVLILVLCVAAGALIVVTADVPVPPTWGFRGVQLVFGATFGTVGAFVARRRPEHAIAWLFISIGLLSAMQAAVEAYVVASTFLAPAELPGMPAVAWLLTWLWVPPLLIALILLPLHFPTGRLPSRAWRPVLGLGVVAIAVSSVILAVIPGPIQGTFVDNPLGLTRLDAAESAALAVLPPTSAGVLAIASLIRRFRGADVIARQQIKWFALAAAIAGVAVAGYITTYAVSAPPNVIKAGEVGVAIGLLGLPIAAGVAILRYRLYDIDRVVSRTIAYGIITGTLAVVYGAAVLVLQEPLRAVAGSDTIMVALSTLAAAAVFQPLRRRVHSVVDRRFDRAHFDTERTAAAFSARLRDEVDIEAVASDLDRTVRTAVRPTATGLWLRKATR